MAGIKTITPPASEPVTLDDIKTQLRFDLSDDSPDETIEPLIYAAREWCEGFQNRAYITQTLEMALDAWPNNAIKLIRPPLQSITSVTYTDESGNTLTWAAPNYLVDDYSQPARLVKKSNISWPTVCLAAVNGIKVRYVAGYDDVDSVPAKTKQAITLLVMHWYENGICDAPDAVKSLLWMERIVPV